MRLEDLQPRSAIRGVHPDGPVTVVSVQWFGSEALELTYRTGRRREWLESRLRELEVLQRGGKLAVGVGFAAPELDPEDVEDLDDAPEQEAEDAEARILDQAIAARSIAELKADLETLKTMPSRDKPRLF